MMNAERGIDFAPPRQLCRYPALTVERVHHVENFMSRLKIVSAALFITLACASNPAQTKPLTWVAFFFLFQIREQRSCFT